MSRSAAERKQKPKSSAPRVARYRALKDADQIRLVATASREKVADMLVDARMLDPVCDDIPASIQAAWQRFVAALIASE